ncbi:MAG: hypothetical protein UY12_C0040G0006 [Parcubacteria group bacterium GW2011_GWA2_47_8b]|uniref:Glutamine synthetase n=1 Tax=Candidatus Harrisonbacteria bacterium RIFOXYA1_FULL_48_8 TaxID=1798411 RepID=A0A1G1ZVU0_9BACT|nr:MAG: hypothetical protein UY12_C0040G0006 [Parcubacteria group bacterium GW2011_GWA2_47_8b]KKU94652.1 MAG: hypothetical protein UY24_C0011G0008 [Parcubacteria group bacterium GW2011_GWA1_48_11b]OGY68246.1 MAG: glutamine synthetase [Candidatus Harrisonbacteria bacterium RIFOXYA1_FULL_48_8]
MERIVEYIWIDGQEPTKKLRSKARVLRDDHKVLGLLNIPIWTFDGSSTSQAITGSSDCFLKPVCKFPDPIRGEPHVLALCEVLNSDRSPHPSNTRAHLVATEECLKHEEALFGIEQEYTLYDTNGGRPYRWPEERTAFPRPQGPYYCGVGSDEVYGRELVEAHLKACLKAGLMIAGINAEVMPAQWEFQVGPLPPSAVADQLWLARWLLYRLGEDFGISAKLSPKPIDGDWNGAGAHTNFSTKGMRDPGGIKVIEQACAKLEAFHKEHMRVYGAENERRLTGKHETCDINTFRWGKSNRGASIRIPLHVVEASCGYLEDRRPAANMDPYEVCRALLETVCGNGFKG